MMRSFVFFMLLGGLFAGAVCAQDIKSPAGWFVIERQAYEEDVAKTDTEDNVQNTEAAAYEMVAKESGMMEVLDGEAHFALNRKDLAMASQWLKWENAGVRGKNFVVSPLSAYAMAVILANGVVDETLLDFSRIFSVLHLSRVNQQLKSYESKHKDGMALYNSLWGESFSQRFQKVLAKALNVEVWGIEGDTSQLNNWLKVRTNGNSADISETETVSGGELFGVGAGYFSAGVLPFFETYYKQEQEFRGESGANNKVLMMWQRGKADYFEDDMMQAVRFFYKTGDFLTIFKSKEEIGFKEFLAGFDGRQLDIARLPGFRRNVNMEIVLPRFRVIYNAKDVKKVLGLFGIKKIFALSNDFAKLVSYDEQVRVKKLYLQAGIVVEGGKAVNGRRPATEDNTEAVFVADRSFVFMINNGDFIGAVVDGKAFEVKAAAIRAEPKEDGTI